MKRPNKFVSVAALVLETLFVLSLFAVHAKSEPLLGGFGTKTLGGRFSWWDEVIYNGWRIQKSATFGHFRLLDPTDHRRTFGTFENCLAELDKTKIAENIPPLPKEVVIVVHGLGATREMMEPLVEYIEKEGRSAVVNFGYPSTVADIGEHAKALESVIQHLDGVETISFVAHSMGNVVIRYCLADLANMPASEQPQITYKRFVMIAPPNHGAAMADNFAESKAAQLFVGEPLQQLAPDRGWPSLEQRLATPSFDFGIIAGGHGDGEGYLAAIPGDDDSLLSVDTTRLAGASDFVLVKGIHQLMPRNKQVHEYTVRFLERGYFLPSGTKHPIIATEVAGAVP